MFFWYGGNQLITYMASDTKSTGLTLAVMRTSLSLRTSQVAGLLPKK